MTNSFDDFVKQQTEAQSSAKIDFAKEQQTWLQNLDKLFQLVEDSLRAHIETNAISVTYEDYPLTEQALGTYNAKAATITIGGSTVVKLKPIGTFLIGARGRVDMIGPRGTARFTIVPPDSSGPRFRVTMHVVGQTPAAAKPEKVDPPETWVWKIATPPPRITYIDLTNESFRETLMGVVNGV